MKKYRLVTEAPHREPCADRKSAEGSDRIRSLENQPIRRSIEPVVDAVSWPLPGRLQRKVVLLVSAADSFSRNLSDAAGVLDLGFKQTDDPVKALWLAGQSRAAVVFVDLDLPAQAGWNIAERLLHNESVPALILLAERTAQLDLDGAIRSGAVMDKSAGPAELLARVSQATAELESDRTGRIARQWMLLRWLRPYDHAAVMMTGDRDRGINE